MDLYFFYNGIINIYNIYNKPQKLLTTEDKLILYDPLVLLHFEKYHKPNFKIQKLFSGGAAKLLAAAMGPKTENDNPNKKTGKKTGENNTGKNNTGNTKNTPKAESNDELKNKIGFMVKIIVLLLFSCIVPLLPWVAISYYTFKKLKARYDESILSL